MEHHFGHETVIKLTLGTPLILVPFTAQLFAFPCPCRLRNLVSSVRRHILTKFFFFCLSTLAHDPYLCRPNSEFMANHKATKKDVRQSAKRRDRNRYNGKTTRNAIRDLKTVSDKAAAGKELPEVISMIDKLAKNGVIHKNKAANLKSKLTKRVNTLA